MPKDLIHYGGWEHRDIHNINGMLYHKITTEGLIARGKSPKRPFVLTRSFFAGSQRYSAMWTGDNLGTWEHMAVGIKMVLSNGIAGMTFAGCACFCFFLFDIPISLSPASAVYRTDTNRKTQLMSAASLAIHNRRCLSVGTGSVHSRRSSAHTHTWIASAVNRISSASPTRAPCATSCAFDTPSSRYGTLRSVRRVSPAFPSYGSCF
jgi:hypothetical protein